MELDFDSSIASIKQEYYLKGVEDGKVKATDDSLESGFREGVTCGIDHGYHLNFLSMIEKLIQKDACNIPQYKSKLDKVKSSIDSTNKEDLEVLKTRVKQVKTNLKLIYNKNNQRHYEQMNAGS